MAGLPPQKARRAAVPHARDGACHTTSTFSEASWSDEGRGGWEPGCPTGIGRVHRTHRRAAMRAVRRPPPFGGQRSAGGNRRSADVIGRFCWWSNSTLLTVAALTLETVGPSGGLQAAASLEMGQFWCSSRPNPSRPGLRRGLVAAAVPTPCQVPTHFAVMGCD